MNDSFGEAVIALAHRVTSAVLLEPVVGDPIFLMGERPEVAESRDWRARRRFTAKCVAKTLSFGGKAPAARNK
jgi:hypothetical protein